MCHNHLDGFSCEQGNDSGGYGADAASWLCDKYVCSISVEVS